MDWHDLAETVGARFLALAQHGEPQAEPLLYRYWLAVEAECQHTGYGNLELLGAREYARRHFAYAVPTNAVLTSIAAAGSLVEIGAGTGYWATLLRERGADVVAYDHEVAGMAAPPPDGGYCDVTHPFGVVRRGGPEAAGRHPDRSLFLCWPPYRSPMAANALAAWSGRQVYYIGEGSGGCTADDRFHDALARDFTLTSVEALPQWWGLHDALEVWARR